jgi:hypothetical protein
MYVSAPFQSTTPTFRRKVLFLVARLKRFLNSQIAAAIAQHEKGVVLLAQQFQTRKSSEEVLSARTTRDQPGVTHRNPRDEERNKINCESSCPIAAQPDGGTAPRLHSSALA